jgi:hypothetical protein
MRSARVLVTVAASAALLSAAGCADAVANSAGVWVEVSPSTVQAGSAVGIRASCGDDVNPATVSSEAFGTLTIQPVNGVLTSTAQVPPTAAEGTSTVTLRCHTGSKATTTLTVLGGTGAAPTMGPHTGGGFLASGDGGLNRESLVWLGLGAAALIAAATVGVRSRRRQVARRR